jgi:HAD superfamily hydrolase (TIGR01484 family)
MYYLALATDYDGTLAHDGIVDLNTLAACDRLRRTGRKLILVTGRELDDLRRVFPELTRFDRIVAENGALLYRPATHEEIALAPPPPPAFIERLQAVNVDPLSVGRAIVATWEPNETVVLEAIRDLGLELQIIFNKGAVMVLPSGVNKASGLVAALHDLGLSPHNVVAVGDAENDHTFLRLCGCAVAVANALPMLKAEVDLVTAECRGAGVTELIERMIADDLADTLSRVDRHRILLGMRDDQPITMTPRCSGLLIAGTSGSGKSTLTTAVLEQLAAGGFQFCIVDPEGDYDQFDKVMTIGDASEQPNPARVVELLEHSEQSVAVNLLAIDIAKRPFYFADLLTHLDQLRARTARPHWIIIDEAHHMLPSATTSAVDTLPQAMKGVMLITVHPEHVSPAILQTIDTIVAMGCEPEQTLEAFCRHCGVPAPEVAGLSPAPGEALLWIRSSKTAPVRIRIAQPMQERRRHVRKYAEGHLGEDKSFYFRGADNKFNLRVQNLTLFVQIAEGVDDATWLHHLRAGDYSRWFRESIKDDGLADDVEDIERQESLTPADSRALVKAAVEKRYTTPI